MSNLKLVFVIGIVGLIGVFGFIQSGMFNIAATERDGPLLSWLLHTTMENSVEKRAGKIVVPDLSGRELILTGASDYVGMCAQCHGEPGKESGSLTQGLNPTPPNLKALAEDGSAAEKFWIITNGIRMTGMPAFGKTHGPEEIWPVVAFIQSAKDMDTTNYNKLVEESKAYGHHTNDEGQEQEHDHDKEDHEVVPLPSIIEDEISTDHNEEHKSSSQHSHSPGAGEHSH
jgi:mono/diheme cytochrome c family protein